MGLNIENSAGAKFYFALVICRASNPTKPATCNAQVAIAGFCVLAWVVVWSGGTWRMGGGKWSFALAGFHAGEVQHPHTSIIL